MLSRCVDPLLVLVHLYEGLATSSEGDREERRMGQGSETNIVGSETHTSGDSGMKMEIQEKLTGAPPCNLSVLLGEREASPTLVMEMEIGDM